MPILKKCVRHISYLLLLIGWLPFGLGCVFAEADDGGARIAALSKIDPSEMIVYQAKNPKAPKAVITVFTDMNCTYCHKFHQEIPKINEAGIEVRYMAYPRRGKGSDSYDKMVTVWCTDNPKDRKKVLEQLMNGENVPAKSCNHSIDDHRNLGRQLGLSGTPTIVFEDGMVWAGYLPADRLVKEAMKHKAKATLRDSKDAHSGR